MEHERQRMGADPRVDRAAQPVRPTVAGRGMARNLIFAIVLVLGFQSFLWMQGYRLIGERLERDLIACYEGE